MSKLAFRAQTFDIAYPPLRQYLLAKKVLMTTQGSLRLGKSPIKSDSLTSYSEGVYMLLDSSGIYKKETKRVLANHQ
jgi:hypothetical protein